MESDKTENPLGNNPDENLRMENELLKLKLIAQFGDAFQLSNSELPPEIENEFLKNVLAFEDAHRNSKFVKVYEQLAKPVYKKAEELSDTEVSDELQRLKTIMEEHNMALDVLATYDDRIIYKFITEELFEQETETGDEELPGIGMTKRFIYEEFHPNHEYDIDSRTKEFLASWFEQKFSEYSWEIGSEIILPDRRILSKQEFLDKIKMVFDSYSQFDNCQYAIKEIQFQLDEETGTGIGHAEGAVKYDAVLESGEVIHMEGLFKLYLSMENDWWQVFYFVFPGFEW